MVNCGTEYAYRLHLRAGEPACQSCRDAVNAASTRRRRARGAKPLGRADHGTVSRYTSGGCRCESCRKAHAAYMKEYRSGMRLSQERSWKNHDRICDLLLIDGGWWTAAGLATRLNISEKTVSRTLYRLRKVGAVQSRTLELARGAGSAVEARQEWQLA